jgi:DNA-binding response OmpR family regulator
VSNLLVVEDDETIGEALTASLRSHGHQVQWQREGYAALRAVAGAEFDLVLLDLGLPDLDGVEVCRRLRAELPGTVLVVLTARTTEMDVVVGLEAAAADYPTKPGRAAELLARLAAEPEHAVSRDALMCDVWDKHWFGPTKTLDVHVAAVRRRLAEAAEATGGATVPQIVTLRGHGYRLETPGGSG